MVVARPQFVSARQETVQEANAALKPAAAPAAAVSVLRPDAAEERVASKPVAAPAVAVPMPGEKFSDEELHSKFGVPAWGGIRVSQEKQCIVLVDLVDDDSKYDNEDSGRTVTYTGQNSDTEGTHNQEMLAKYHPVSRTKQEPSDPSERRTQAAANNLVLSLSKTLGYTVLYFIKQKADLAFDSCVECDSDYIELEEKDGKLPRTVIKFTLRRVDRMPAVAADELAADAILDSVEMVEGVLSSSRKFDTRQALLGSLPRKVSRESLDSILDYLARSGKINTGGGSVQWVSGNLREAMVEAEIAEGYIETLEILANHDLVKQVKESEEDIRAGRVVPWVKGTAQNTR